MEGKVVGVNCQASTMTIEKFNRFVKGKSLFHVMYLIGRFSQ